MKRFLLMQQVARGLMGGVAVVLFASACHSLGPRSITKTHGAYGHAIALSRNEQFLQNLVKLRYRESPYFLEVNSVTASLSFQSALGVESELSTGPGADLVTPNLGAGYSTSPTISYSPLQGEDFLRKVLVNVPVESLFVLMQSGWSAERVFGICVERINGLENAPTASGPTPSSPPKNFAAFERFLELMESVQNSEWIRYAMDSETGMLSLEFEGNSSQEPALREIKNLLGIDPNKNVYSLSNGVGNRGPDVISIRTRSIMSILFYLSQSVEVPPEHEEAGYVTVTRYSDGGRFDWRATPAGQRFRVFQSERPPRDAYLAVPYRRHWFAIADDDLDSKASFMLISQLFRLNAGAVEGVRPTLTIPVGR